MKKTALTTLAILLATALTTACKQAAQNPRDVAQQYWQALKAGDTNAARELVTTETQPELDAYLQLPADQKTALGDVNLGAEKTTVVTIVYPDAANPEDYRAFETVLELENGQWKVDASQSLPPKPSVPTDQEMDELAEQLNESVQENIESIEEAMSEGMRMLHEAMRQGSQDMGESLLKGMEELNRSMQESIEQMQKRRELQEQQEQQAPSHEGEGLL
jgi:hypothetical protein